ncbi:MAG: FixH family protein [Chloroflexota bacterium]|nr:MAG: FixH family protein [Chloroflexota bacterium]
MNRIRSLLVALILLSAALMVVACGTDEQEPEMEEEMAMDEGEEMDDMAMGGAPEGLDTSTEKMTDDGVFHVSISSELDPLALNEIHGWTIHVETADGQAVEGAQISVDGGMPEHNHGFPTEPEITEELGGGDYLLEGVKFSMAGWWELKLNIAADDQADNITFNLVLP